MEAGTSRVKLLPAPAESPSVEKCIICQTTTSDPTISNANGRKRIREAADIRKDIVTKRIKLLGDHEENFVYHMTNDCYKKYTLRKTLNTVIAKSKISDQTSSAESANEPELRRVRSQGISRPPPSPRCDIYSHKCVICSHVKHLNVYEKFRICETDRAKKFLEATVFLQDYVYSRTCDLQDEHSVFGADLFCHKLCIRNYIAKFDRAKAKSGESQPMNAKKRAWFTVMPEIETGIRNGDGYELSHVRDRINSELNSDIKVNNREVKVLLTEHFGSDISFSQPKQVNKSQMFFSRTVTAENLAETIRSTDPIRQCAETIRQCLLELDFDLQDRFCDANDLETATANMVVPEPLLKFFAVLYNFDIDSFAMVSKKLAKGLGDFADDENDCGVGVSEQKCRQVQGLTQTLYYILHRGRKRTPMHMMNSQAIYEACRSATLITSFNRYGLCISYDEVQRYHNDMGRFIVESSSDEVPFPSHFGSSQFTIAAFDNFDHDEATLSGIGGSHDTVSVLFQDDDGSKVEKPRISETRTEHGPKTFNCELKCQELQPFYKPAKRADLSADYATETHPVDKDLLQAVRKKDLAWSLARLDLSENQTSINIKPSDQTMPAWRETNTVLSEKDISKKRVGFLPVLPYPVTQYDTVYTALKNFNGILQHLEQHKLPVTCDEGVYHIAREIQLIRPEEFQDIVLCMGSFHMAKVALGCLGKYLKGSGAESILVESATFGVNVVDSVLGGKNYSRSLKGLQLLKEALLRLQWEAFFKEGDNVQEHKEQLDMLVDLKGKVASSSNESAALFRNFEEKTPGLFSNFDQFIDHARSTNETFKYWDTFIHLIQQVENLVRADRDGDWALHLQAVQALLPIFAAFDSTNYLRWCSLYLEDMHKLPDTAPAVYQAFMAGKFVVKRTHGKFNAVGADMALEQTINRSQKSASGIIGNTRKKKFVAMWELIYHEMLAISNLFRESSGVSSSLSEEHVISKVGIATGEQKVQAIIATIERNENPFQLVSDQVKLHNILTQEVMSDEIRSQLLSVIEIGTKAYETMRKERFVEKSVRFSSTLHRTNLKTFLSLHKPEKGNKGKSCGKKKEDAQMMRSIEVTRARGRTMEELLQYDVSSTSYLFDQEGLMTKPQKSALVQDLETKLTNDDERVPTKDSELQTACIADVMANIRKIKTKDIQTFGEFCEQFLDYISAVGRGPDRLDLVFDSYVEGSIKDSERNRRRDKAPIEMNYIHYDTPLPVEMDRFWSSSNNKLKLQMLLHTQAMKRGIETPSTVHVVASCFSGASDSATCKGVMDGNSAEIPDLCPEVEEADARIIPHAMHAVRSGIQRIVVLSGDTDVFVLLMHYWDILHSEGLRELWIRAGVGDSTRYIPVHILAPKIGKELCYLLPLVHTLTGCDYTSKVGTKHAALNANPSEYLNDFDSGPSCTDDFAATCEAYLVQMLKRNTTCTTMDQLRDYIYHHSKRVSLDQLPPTSHAVQQHIRRAYYATYQMVTLLHPHKPTVLNPTAFGFKKTDELLLPIKGLRPIPEEYTILCNCKKCSNDRCACRKAGLPCISFCKCQSLQGHEQTVQCKNPSGSIHG